MDIILIILERIFSVTFIQKAVTPVSYTHLAEATGRPTHILCIRRTKCFRRLRKSVCRP